MIQQTGTPTGGLRERKKQRTREELIEAGLRLFLDQGFEHTTVDQIAAAVEVSQRTFFRYFASKEEIAFGVMTATDEMFHEYLRRRPPEDTPLQALRGAMRDTWRTMTAGCGGAAGPETALHLRMVRLIESTPALLAAHLRRTGELEDRLAAELARREGVDADGDPRPRLLSSVFGAVVRVSNRTWTAEGECDLETMQGTMERYFDSLQSALGGPWGEGQSERPGIP